MKLRRSQARIRRLTKSELHAILEEFEKKHGMTSKEFVVKFHRCELEEHPDFVAWASYCEMLLRDEYAKAHAGA